MVAPDKDTIEKSKRSFASYEENEEGTLVEIARYTGKVPSSAAMKATNKKAKRLGITEEIDTVIREVNKRRKDGKIMLRFYKGRVKEDIRISPDIGSFQEDLAIKQGSFVLGEDGKVAMSPFPDGYDSTDDPRLEGKRPLYKARIAVVKFIKTEPIPEGMKLTKPTT